MRASLVPILAVLSGMALLAGCDRGSRTPDPALQQRRSTDPLIAATVAEPLMSDQALSFQANLDAVRPPDAAIGAPIPAIDIAPTDRIAGAPPLPDVADGNCAACRASDEAVTLDALAARLAGPAVQPCLSAVGYSAIWATRLPRDTPLPAAARVIEAAGSDAPGCHLRLVAYGAAVPLGSLLASESARFARAGYRVTYARDGAVHVLTAARARDGSTLTLIGRDASGIADLRLVVTRTG
ncbi:hypothetical protein ASE86_03270 [Sphingomonas sp. Leaf33]|uniref:hypothetical protein n=1 Tax=Sphingomonas sp. Leaf33 TaxID=1736215 RepID=UPI0006F3185A|nr:hypothetical protein [Sphingomonas sp. Leaf33]KQN25282.1 hypothetical protein ASE86_03270 [Sphingomonas sp. Leaf33]